LHEDRAFFRVEAAGQIIDDHFRDISGDRGLVLIFRGQGVQVRDHEEGVFALEFFVIFDRAEKVPQVKLSGGPCAA